MSDAGISMDWRKRETSSIGSIPSVAKVLAASENCRGMGVAAEGRDVLTKIASCPRSLCCLAKM